MKPNFCFTGANGQTQTPNDVMQMMIDAKNLKFADLNSLRRFPPFSRMPKEPEPYKKAEISPEQQKAGEFYLEPAIEKHIHEKHTNLVNQWRNEDSQACFQIVDIAWMN